MNELNKYIVKIEYATELSKEQKDYYVKIANKLYELNYPIILNSYHLSNLCGIKWQILKKLIGQNSDNYHQFYITKKDGILKREILSPSKELSHVQKYIKEQILDKVPINKNCFGFVKNKNIKFNAQMHLNNQVILNIDLKDFFPSINSRRVYYIFNKICCYDKTLSYCFTKLVTYRNMLPQGACTSPVLSNIVSYKLDLRLSNLAKKNDVIYTRYADDITFSGSKDKITYRFYLYVKKIIENEGFNVNEKKVHLSTKSCRQEVTGLIVNNGKIVVNSKYIRKIKQELYYINKFGLDNHIERSNIKNGFYIEHLKGKIMFVRDIDRETGEKLLKQFNELKIDN